MIIITNFIHMALRKLLDFYFLNIWISTLQLPTQFIVSSYSRIITVYYQNVSTHYYKNKTDNEIK